MFRFSQKLVKKRNIPINTPKGNSESKMNNSILSTATTCEGIRRGEGSSYKQLAMKRAPLASAQKITALPARYMPAASQPLKYK